MISARTIVLLSLCIPFTLLHLSVVVFVMAARRRDCMIRSGFYTIFVVTAIADIVHQLEMTIWQLLPVMWWDIFGFLIQADENASPTVMTSFINTSLTFVILVQGLGHTTMAINRFSCFYFRGLHDKLWNGWRFAVLICSSLLLPVAGTAYFIPFGALIYPIQGKDGASIVYKDEFVDALSMYVLAGVYVPFALVGFAFSVATVISIQSLRSASVGQTLTANAEFRLFAHSLLMLLLQLYLSFHYLFYTDLLPTFFYGSFMSDLVPRLARFAIGAYNLSVSPFLLIISPETRRKYIAFYFGWRPKSPVVSVVS